MRISRSNSKAQYKGDTRYAGLWDPYAYVAFVAPISVGSAIAPTCICRCRCVYMGLLGGIRVGASIPGALFTCIFVVFPP